jgi:accessory gene regulator B
MRKLSAALTDYIINKGVIKEVEREIYEYGFLVIFETALSFIISILVAISLNMVFEGILFFVIFIPLRINAGGLHLEHYLTCLTLSCLTYLGILLMVMLIKIPIYLSVSVLVLLIMATWLLYPAENINRPLDKEEMHYFKNRLKLFLVVDILLSIVCLVYKKEKYVFLIMLTFLLIIITMVISKIRSRKNIWNRRKAQL